MIVSISFFLFSTLPPIFFLLFILSLKTAESYFIDQGGFEPKRLTCSFCLNLLVAGTQAILQLARVMGKIISCYIVS